MGCWNETCMVSNLHIRARQKIVMFLLVEHEGYSSMCYSTGMFNPCPIPIYGYYNDYGGIEDVYGPLTEKLVALVKADLMEMPEGDNQYHDRAVSKQGFDFDALMQAETDGRLNVIDFSKFQNLQSSIDSAKLTPNISKKQQDELDRLYVRLAQPKNIAKNIKKVYIHGDVFDAILDKWYIEHYVGHREGTAGYDNSYNYLFYKDVVATIPQFIEAIKESVEKIPDSPISGRLARAAAGEKSTAGKFLSYFESHDYPRGLFYPNNEVDEYIGNKDWDNLAIFVQEILKTLWLHIYFENTRKTWCITSGSGGQGQDHRGYQVLIDAMQGVLNSEKAECDEDYEDDEDIAPLDAAEVQKSLSVIKTATDVIASLTK